MTTPMDISIPRSPVLAFTGQSNFLRPQVKKGSLQIPAGTTMVQIIWGGDAGLITFPDSAGSKIGGWSGNMTSPETGVYPIFYIVSSVDTALGIQGYNISADDLSREMSVNLYPMLADPPDLDLEFLGGGGFLGSFFSWLGGQSDRTSRLRLPLDVHHPVSAGGRQRIPADPGISAGQWEYVHRAFSPPRGLPSGGCMAGIHIGGLLLEDSSHLVPGAVNSLPGKWGNKVFGSLHNDCPGGAVGSTHAETWNGDDTIPHRPRLGCVGPGDPSGAQRSTLTLAVA